MDKIIVKKEFSRIRLDAFLSQEFFSMSRSEIARKIKAGEVLVNNIQIKPSYTLKENDVISINFKLDKETLLPNQDIKLEIIYQDENIIVINKPAGIQVHLSSEEKKNTIVNGLIYKFPEIISVHDNSLGAEFRPGIVHRLDKDTSGIMVVARNQKTFEELKYLFQERKISKKYIALIYGQLKERKGIITKAIARASNYRKQVIAGRKTKTKVRGAVTNYKQLERMPNFTLVEAIPKTGRMHQIRIHFFSIGHPIVGDKLYIQKENVNRYGHLSPRQLLHASEISFSLFGKKYDFVSPLPQDFRRIIEKIKEM